MLATPVKLGWAPVLDAFQAASLCFCFGVWDPEKRCNWEAPANKAKVHVYHLNGSLRNIRTTLSEWDHPPKLEDCSG